MDQKETNQLFTLLAQFYPNKKVNDTLRLAWSLALKPYRYEDVKAGAIAHAREKKFFPDIHELTNGLRIDKPLQTTKAGHAELESVSNLAAWHAQYKAECAANGIQTAANAIAAGMPLSEWIQKMEEHHEESTIEPAAHRQ